MSERDGAAGTDRLTEIRDARREQVERHWPAQTANGVFVDELVGMADHLRAELAEQRRLNLDLSARVEAQCGLLARSAERQLATFGPPAVILYRNWRGETRPRTVKVQRFWAGSTVWHPEFGILFDATDVESGEERTFALSGVMAPWGSAEHPDTARVVELDRQAEGLRRELERLRGEYEAEAKDADHWNARHCESVLRLNEAEGRFEAARAEQARIDHEVEQCWGRLLGCPPAYPDVSPVDDGSVVVTEGVPGLALRAAAEITRLRAELARLTAVTGEGET